MKPNLDERPDEQRWRLNLRTLLILASVLLLGSVGLALAWSIQNGRTRSTLLQEARARHEANDDRLALSYLTEYLNRAPRDVEALELKAEILVQSAASLDNLLEAIPIHEQILRSERDPKSERCQKSRRELVRLHLSVGPYLPRMLVRYQTADVLARQLVEAGARDAEVYRLWAQVQRRLAILGDDKATARAIELYETARRLEPGDISGAEQLAAIYRDIEKDPAKARTVVDELVAANPSAQARLARFRFLDETARYHLTRGRGDLTEVMAREADAELTRAVEQAPKDLDVLLTAAEHALGHNRTQQARAFLARVPETERSDTHYKVVAGLVELSENRSEEAIATWRRGLVDSEGSNTELTWWLAYIHLEMGRIDEAQPLIDQYRRLVGGDTPNAGYRYLVGLRHLKRNHAIDAIRELLKTRAVAKPELKAQIEYTLGRAYEAIRDHIQALEAYRQAILANPELTAARIARDRLLQLFSHAEAELELRQGLEQVGRDPNLIATLARGELQRQLAQPRDRRDWTRVQKLIDRGRQLNADAPALAMVEADYLAAIGQAKQADERLAAALKSHPRDPELWVSRSSRQMAMGDLDQALALLEQAASPEACGDQPTLRIARARLLDALGRDDEARDALVANLDRVRIDQRPALWMALGDLYIAHNDTAGARLAYSQGARLLPDDPLPRLLLFDLILHAGSNTAEDQTTLSNLLKELERIGGKEGSYTRLARAMAILDGPAKGSAEERTARLDEAEKLIIAARGDSPDQRYAYILLGRLMELRERPADAVAAYEQALQREGGEIVEPRLMALYTQLGREVELARLRLKRSEAPPSLDRFAAEASLRLGHKERAERLAHRVVEGDPDSLDARVWQARVLDALGKPEKAEASLRELIAKEPSAPGPWMALLFFQVGRHRDVDAAQTIEQIQKNVKVLHLDFLLAQCWQIAGRRDKADAAYEAALKAWPDEPKIVRGAAAYYEATGRADRAESLLRETLRRDPSRRDAARALALLLSSHPGNTVAWQEAWALLSGESKDSEVPEDRFARAIVLSRANDPEHLREATRLLEGLIHDLPPDLPATASARALLGRAYLRMGRADEAARIAALDAGEDADIPAIQRYCEALIAAKSLDEAQRQLDRLAKDAPDEPETTLLRARLCLARSRPDEAVAALRENLDARLDHPKGRDFAREAVRLLLELNRLDDAEHVARTLADRWPDSTSVLATVLARQEKTHEALDLFRNAVETADPPALREIVQNSLVLATAGPADSIRLRQVDDIVSAAIRRAPNDPVVLVRGAFLRHLQRRYHDEIELYRQALRAGPTDFTFLNNMAWTLCEGLNQPKDALSCIDDAIRRAGKAHAPFLDTRGVIHTRLGQLDKAIADLEASNQAQPNPATLAHLARAYHKAGRDEDFRRTRDEARRAGLTPEQLESEELADLGPLLFDREFPPPPRSTF